MLCPDANEQDDSKNSERNDSPGFGLLAEYAVDKSEDDEPEMTTITIS